MVNKSRNILKFVSRHKYSLTLIVFILIVGVIDSNSLLKRHKLIKENDFLRDEIEYYENISKRDSSRLKQLKENSKAIIRVAREDYLMKAENEDVFIIIEE